MKNEPVEDWGFDFDPEDWSFDFDPENWSFDFDPENWSFDFDPENWSFDFDPEDWSFDFDFLEIEKFDAILPLLDTPRARGERTDGQKKSRRQRGYPSRAWGKGQRELVA